MLIKQIVLMYGLSLGRRYWPCAGRHRTQWHSGMSTANGLVGTGFASRYRFQPTVGF